MKKILLTGIVILLAVFFVTCEEFFPEETKVEYTNVVYSQDGSQVKLYLDGIGVPVTKAQRAMSLELSKMAYDYLEVIFYNSATNVARAQWELGQSPTISGVTRGVAYSKDTIPVALMAVGTKDGKTLLGVGHITDVDGNTGTPLTLTATASYVTFTLIAVKTGLLVGTETTAGTGAAYDSLSFTPTTIKTSATRTPLGDASYPMYPIPVINGVITPATATGTYTFGGALLTANYLGQLKFARSAAPYADVEKRIPRYMDNGRYMIPKGNINTRSKVTLGTSYAAATLNEVPLSFTFAGTGIFSFYIDIPVILYDAASGTNNGLLKPITWHVRTGFGSELYSLDDGISSGGCVLMGIGVSSLDWLNIEWKWETP